MNEPRAATRLALIAAAVALGVVLLIAFVDRPLAQAVHGSPWVAWFDRMTLVASPLAPASTLALALAAAAACAGWRPGPRIAGWLAVALAVVLASLAKDELKYVFGRTWPETWTGGNPSFIHDGVFGFFPFHGGKGWASFPSGHTIVCMAAVAAAWSLHRAVRIVGPLLVGLVVVGLLGADYHWASDVLAGGGLGALLGAGVARWLPQALHAGR